MARQQGDRQSRSFGGSTAVAAEMVAIDNGCAGEIPTRSTYRLLLMRGLEPGEAANLTAYLCGIDVAGATWSIAEVNRILFLRNLARSGRWGGAGDRAGDGLAPMQAWPAAA
jgi:hypothetical protein